MKLVFIFLILSLLTVSSYAGRYAGSPNDVAAPIFAPTVPAYPIHPGYHPFPNVPVYVNHHWQCLYRGNGYRTRWINMGTVNGVDAGAALSNCYNLINGGYPFNGFYDVRFIR